VYGIGTDGELIGVVFMGFKGAIGEHVGYTILQATAWVLLGLGAATSVLRDADPEAQAAAARLESLPAVVAPAGASYWPVLGAVGAVVAAVGLVASPVLFVIGLLVVGLVMLEWMVSAWAERATGDPALNHRIRNRLMYPIEIPLFGALGILVMVVSVSRVFLAVSRIGSSVVAIVIASLVLLAGFAFAYRPKLGRNVVAGVLAVFAVLVIAGGIIGAASGTRDFDHHGSEHTDEPGAGGSHEAPDDGAGLPADTDEDEG
jgi:hypothetical protein